MVQKLSIACVVLAIIIIGSLVIEQKIKDVKKLQIINSIALILIFILVPIVFVIMVQLLDLAVK